jgi:predicted esterase
MLATYPVVAETSQGKLGKPLPGETRYHILEVPDELPVSDGMTRYRPKYLGQVKVEQNVIYQTLENPRYFEHREEMPDYLNNPQAKHKRAKELAQIVADRKQEINAPGTTGLRKKDIKKFGLNVTAEKYFRDYTMNIFMPVEEVNNPQKPAVEKRPLVVFMHGGGWIRGSKGGTKHQVANVLARAGYVVAVFDYRIWSLKEKNGGYKPTTAYPGYIPSDKEAGFTKLSSRIAAANDLERAINFLRNNAAEYGIDPDRIGIAGYSAGAASPLEYVYKKDAGKGHEFLKAVALHAGSTRNKSDIEKNEAPLCMVLGSDDRIFKYSNVYRTMERCENVGLTYEFHTMLGLGHSIADTIGSIKGKYKNGKLVEPGQYVLDDKGLVQFDSTGSPIKNPHFPWGKKGWNGKVINDFLYRWHELYPNLSTDVLDDLNHTYTSLPTWVNFLEKHLAGSGR